jgi:polyisoprenoid-binding protein YceI
MPSGQLMRRRLTPLLLALLAIPTASHAAVPVFAIDQPASTVRFHLKASRPVQGRFKTWTASLTFATPEISTGVLDVQIDTASVDSGNARADRLLRSGQGFDVKDHPRASFHSTRIAQTGPDTFAVTGDFTLRGVTKSETLVLKVTRAGSAGEIDGTMSFDRRDFGMTASVPFMKIADRVDVTVDVKAARVSGPPVAISP